MEQKNNLEKTWDVVVVGGGPAGMIAAGRAAECGCSVLLLEKNCSLGNKLLLTGGGRCNFTNHKPDIRSMLAKYKGSDQFLFSAFSQFGVEDTINFFESLGMETKEEEEGRVFPVSDRAQTVLEVLVEYMKAGRVQIKTGLGVVNLDLAEDGLFKIELNDGVKLLSKSCILATGGMAYPQTGSTGDGLMWLKKIGHTILDNQSSLVPVKLKDGWAKKISGVTLKDVELSICLNKKKQVKYKGDLLFTHFGISGPMVLNMSREVGELLKTGEVVINLDLLPEFDQSQVKQKLQDLFLKNCNKKIKNVLGEIIVSTLVEPILKLAGVDGETFNHSLKSEDRTKIILLIKAVPLHVGGLLSPEKAIYSVGGVDLREIDFKTMQSRLIPNLYIVGDLLNVDRPSGGYSLQLCWTTGYVAGSNVVPILGEISNF